MLLFTNQTGKRTEAPFEQREKASITGTRLAILLDKAIFIHPETCRGLQGHTGAIKKTQLHPTIHCFNRFTGKKLTASNCRSRLPVFADNLCVTTDKYRRRGTLSKTGTSDQGQSKK